MSDENQKVDAASIVTVAQVESYAKRFEIDLETDASQWPGCVGSLREWENGNGTFDDKLATDEDTKELFAPLKAAFDAAVAAKA